MTNASTPPFVNGLKPYNLFRWEAVDRTTGTVYREDENGLGSFSSLNPMGLASITIIAMVLGSEVGITHEVPEGAQAIFTRRRSIPFAQSKLVTANLEQSNTWTIIGHTWPESDGRASEYHFFHDSGDAFVSDNFNAV